MTDRENIEAKIREVIATETNAISLSNRLFAPGALFSQLASNREERQALVKTQLFRDAQRRLRELQEVEMAAFREATKLIGERLPYPNARIRFEVTEPPRENSTD